MARYPARSAVMYLSTTGSGTATNVIAINAWTINATTDRIDVTAFGDANKVTVPGLPDLSGTFSGWWDDTESKPFTAASSSTGCNMYLYPSADAPSKFWSGPAWIDVSMDCSVAGAVAISGNISARGSWAKTF